MLKRIFFTLVVLFLAAIGSFGFFVVVMRVTEPISPGGFKHVNTGMWDQGYAAASGSWMMLNDRSAHPIQTSKIWCVKEQSVCYEALAKIVDNRYITSEFYSRDIASWSDKSISFIDKSSTCAVYHYTLDRHVSQVTARRTTVKSGSAGCGDIRDNLDMVLGDGFTVWKQERDRRTPWTLIGFVVAIILLATLHFIYRIWKESNAPHREASQSAA